MTCGIYKILNKINGKFYIGSAVNIIKRRIEHLSLLRRNIHPNDYFQKAWNKYGEENFKFYVIQVCSEDDLLKYEQIWLDCTKCFEREVGYNILAVAANSLGYIHTKENRIKMRQAQLGKKQSQEHKDNKAAMMRKIDKWPCLEGSRCKCDRCRLIKNKYAVNWIRDKKLRASVSA